MAISTVTILCGVLAVLSVLSSATARAETADPDHLRRALYCAQPSGAPDVGMRLAIAARHTEVGFSAAAPDCGPEPESPRIAVEPAGPTAVPAAPPTATIAVAPGLPAGLADVAHDGLLAGAVAHGHVALAVDNGLGGGSTTGVVRGSRSLRTHGQPFTEDVTEVAVALRAGARVPLGPVALEGGTGVTGTLAMIQRTHSDYAHHAHLPRGAQAGLALPVWAALTVRPTCEWGVQLMASYNLQSTSMGDLGDHELAVGGGILYQPSAACPAGGH